MKTVQVHKTIVMTRSTCLCTLLGCRNESWGPLSTFTTIEVWSETPCLKHPVAALSLNSYHTAGLKVNSPPEGRRTTPRPSFLGGRTADLSKKLSSHDATHRHSTAADTCICLAGTRSVQISRSLSFSVVRREHRPIVHWEQQHFRWTCA